MRATLEGFECIEYGVPIHPYLCPSLLHTTKELQLPNKMYIKKRSGSEQRESISAYPRIYEKVNVQIDVGCQV